MAGNIKGLTIEISADVTGFEKSIASLNKDIRSTQKDLRDIDKLLKLDPKSVELLRQKQEKLTKAIEDTKKKLDLEKQELAALAKADQTPEVKERMEKLERQIASDKKSLEKLEGEFKDFGSVGTQQIKAVGKELEAAGKKVQDFGKKLAPVSGAAAALGGALVKMGFDAVSNADDLNTLAQQTGLSTAEIQKMRYASELVDVSFEDVAGALRKMKGNMDGHPETWERLGVSVTDADGNMRDATDVFYDAIGALSQVKNETERDQLAMDLFGKSADQLAGVIDDGGQSMKEFGDQAEEAGLILSQDTLDALSETDDAIQELKNNFSATAGAIGADIALTLSPALEELSGYAEDLTAKLRDLTPEQTTAILAIAGVVAVITPVLIIIGQLISAVGAIAGALAPVIAAIGAFAAAFGAPIVAIGLAIAAFVGFLKYHEKIEAKTQEVADKLKAKWEEVKTNVSASVENMKLAIAQKWEEIKNRVSATADGIKNSVQQKFTAVKEAITKPIDDAKNKVQNAIQKIKDTVNNVKLSLPHFKLPHFRISGGQAPWGLGGQGTKPSISVDWYKKAYENPIMFTKPTVLETAGGLKGFGDGSGAEIVMSLNKLRDVVGAAGDTYITVNAAPGMNVRQLADEVARRMTQAQRQRSAVYA